MNHLILDQLQEEIDATPERVPLRAALEGARDAIEAQNRALVRLAELWGHEACWELGLNEPCSRCKACVTTALLAEVGAITVPDPKQESIFDLFPELPPSGMFALPADTFIDFSAEK